LENPPHFAAGIARLRKQVSMSPMIRSVCLTLILIVLTRVSTAQELKVYTTIRDLSGPGAAANPDQAPVVVRSLMLFHAGKVYDVIEPAQEVTIFEPAHKRFTVLNKRRQLCTELSQDEIRQFLNLAENEVCKRMEILTEENTAAARKSLDVLRFQFQPDFAAEFDTAKLHLTMNGDNCQYTVDGFQPPASELLERYLHVADWMAQFNSVLHPQSLFPAPRLKLNQELRKREILPLKIVLKANTDPPLQLQAQHKWNWNFAKSDRQMIDEWERQLRDPLVRKVEFRQFQQEMLRKEITRR
jgi:hypothetical protein